MQTFVLLSLFAILLLGPTAGAAALPPEVASAQQAAPQAVQRFELVLRDGTRIVGTIESETPDRVVIRTTGGARVEAYLGVYELFLPFVQVGLTDRSAHRELCLEVLRA